MLRQDVQGMGAKMKWIVCVNRLVQAQASTKAQAQLQAGVEISASAAKMGGHKTWHTSSVMHLSRDIKHSSFQKKSNALFLGALHTHHRTTLRKLLRGDPVSLMFHTFVNGCSLLTSGG